MRTCKWFAIAMTFVCWPLLAQLDRGALTGTVTDSTGGVAPGVSVGVRNTATGATYRTQSNSQGQYTVPNLPVGTYELTFETNGFRKVVRSGVSVGVAQMARVDAVLEVGSVTQSVEVTADVSRLETETPQVGTSLSDKQLLDLPLSFGGARTAENFAYKISPGVGGSAWTSHIGGSTSFSKETLLEGATATTNRSGEYSQMSVSVEAVQEFRVQTGGLSAEFGRTQAGVFNYVLKSGANELHGSAYGALRNEALNANTFVDNARGLKRTAERKFNYAGSFGGPVYLPKLYDGHNRTFFYTSYEHFRERTNGFGAPNRTVPLPEFYDGDFSRLLGPATGSTDALGRPVARGAIYDPATFRQEGTRWVGDVFPGNRIPTSRFSQVSRNLNGLARKHYLPTVREANGQFALLNNSIFPRSTTPEFDQHQFSVKMDQIVNDRHKLAGSYVYNTRPRLLLDQGGMWDQAEADGGPLSKAHKQTLHSMFVRLAHDWTLSPRLLNHIVVFGNRNANPNYGVHQDIDGAAELGIKNLSTFGYPTVNWGGGPFVSLMTPGDAAGGFTGVTAWGFLNTVSFFRERHFMKVGFDFRRNHANDRARPGGAFTFNPRATAIPGEAFAGNLTGYSFASYLLGIVDSAALSDPAGQGYRRSYYAMFFQDDYKVNNRLTLQLGLRWEYESPVYEVGDRLSSWNPSKIDPRSGLPGAVDFAGSCQGCTGRSYFGLRDYNNFGPRIGFAWQPTSAWTLRGAYGILFEGEALASALLGKSTNSAWGGTYELSSDPVTPWRGIFNWDAGFPTNRFVPAAFDPSWGNRNRPGMFDPRYGTLPYIQQWNFNMQRQLAKNLILDVGYLGSKGTALRAGDLAAPNQLPTSVLTQYGTRLNNAVRNEAEAAANGIRYPFPGFAGTVASALRQYPQVNGNQTVDVYRAPLGFSNYHSLQVTVNRQFSRGLTAYGNFAWSKAMANMQSSVENENGGRPLDYYNLSLEKSISDHDQPIMVKAYLGWDVPVGRGRQFLGNAGKVANALFGGWSVSAIMNYFSGTPIGFSGSFPLSGGWNGATNRINIAPGDMMAQDYRGDKFELSAPASQVNTYLNKSVYSDPVPLTLGRAAYRYTQVRSFPTLNEDLGLQKVHRFSEKCRLQLRAEFLNLLNRHQLGGVNTNVTNALFGQVTSVSGNRQVQLGARFDF